MIPKIIHYCWFGRGEKPKLALKCIESWRKYCPDYQIIEWNEDNFDIASAPLFVRQAIENRKWAFATDYIRYQAVYEYGGIYMDTDVEVVRSLDPFLRDAAFFGFQYTWKKNIVASGLGFGAEKGLDFLQELMDVYRQSPLVQPDGAIDNTPNTHKEAEIFEAHGLRADGTEQMLDGIIHIYPSAYFAPYDYSTGKMTKTRDTASIHWYGFSWGSKKEKKEHLGYKWKYLLFAPLRLLKRLLGSERYGRLRDRIKSFPHGFPGRSASGKGKD